VLGKGLRLLAVGSGPDAAPLGWGLDARLQPGGWAGPVAPRGCSGFRGQFWVAFSRMEEQDGELLSW